MMLGITSIIVVLREGDVDSDEPHKWLGLYLAGSLPGIVGLLSLVKENWSLHTVKVITYVFSSFSLFFLIYSVGSCFHGATKMETYYVIILYGFVHSVGFGVLVAIYSDWILGAIAGNLAGEPSSDIATIYWLYFVAKRLPNGIQ